MAPLRQEFNKWLSTGGQEEKVIHSYWPSFGGSVIDDPRVIDQRILTHLKSGSQFQKLVVSITNKRITFELVVPSCSQIIEMYYQDLIRINVGQSFGLPHKVSLHDSRGLAVWLEPPRPHFVAVELWIAITMAVAAHYEKIGRIQNALQLISSIDISSVKVPDDFVFAKGSEFAELCALMGIILPVNGCPYWQLPEKYLTESHNGSTTMTLGHDSVQPNSISSSQVIGIDTSISAFTTASAISSGTMEIPYGSVPIFQPSLADLPATMLCMDSVEDEVQWAIENSPTYFQSFYNDLCPITPKGIDDDVISGNCFDEGLYCALVKEMHRYTLAEVGANQDQIAKSNAGLGAMVGSFLGLITGNIFAPFLGHTYGKNMTDRSRRIEEFLPDPVLLFNQDPNSYSSWLRGQVSAPRLRRLIIDKQSDGEGRVYFRLVPAIVTADSVYPIQLFKLGSSSYFYRPLAAGIGDEEGRKQPYYDPIKIQRKYFHIRAEGEVTPADISLKVFGRDIEDYDVKLYRYVGHSLDYFYADFKIQPGSVF